MSGPNLPAVPGAVVEFPLCVATCCARCGAQHVDDGAGWLWVAVAMRGAPITAPLVLCPSCAIPAEYSDAAALARWVAAHVLRTVAEQCAHLLATLVRP